MKPADVERARVHEIEQLRARRDQLATELTRLMAAGRNRNRARKATRAVELREAS